MLQSFAPILTRVDGTTSATLIQSGRPIRVFGIILSRTSTTAINFTFADANGNTLWTFTFSGSFVEPVSLEVPFIADKGLRVAMDQTNGEVIVFHTHEGT